MWMWREFPRATSRRSLLMALYYFYAETLTSWGKTWLNLFVALFVLEMAPGWSGAAPFLALLGSALLRSWAWSRSLRSTQSLHLTNNLPPRGRAGEECNFSLRLSNTGSKTLRYCGLLLTRLPDALVQKGDGAWTGTLAPAGVVNLEFSLFLRNRGVYNLHYPQLMHSDALGLARCLVRFPSPLPWQMIVHPRAMRIKSADFLYKGDLGVEFARVLALADGEPEFLGLREYREGDEMRDIHQQAWARLGRPVVREWGRLRGGGLSLHLWNQVDKWWDRSYLEQLYELVDGMAQWLYSRNALGAFYWQGELQNVASAQEISDLLAALPPSGPLQKGNPNSILDKARDYAYLKTDTNSVPNHQIFSDQPQLHLVASPALAWELIQSTRTKEDSVLKVVLVGDYAKEEDLPESWQKLVEGGYLQIIPPGRLQNTEVSL